MFDVIRLRSSRMSLGSHANRFHALFTVLVTPFCLDSNSMYLSNVLCSSSRTFLQLSEISWRSVFCCWLSSYSDRTISTSWRTIERLLTLSSQAVSSRQPYDQVTHSSEISLNWLGAPTNSLRTLLTNSIIAMKSPILVPMLILTFDRPHHRIRRKARE